MEILDLAGGLESPGLGRTKGEISVFNRASSRHVSQEVEAPRFLTRSPGSPAPF